MSQNSQQQIELPSSLLTDIGRLTVENHLARAAAEGLAHQVQSLNATNFELETRLKAYEAAEAEAKGKSKGTPSTAS